MSKLIKDIIECDFCNLSTKNRLSFSSHIKSCNIVRDNLDSILSEYKNGYSLRGIISKYKISRLLMVRILEKNSLSIRNLSESLIGRIGKPHTDETKKRMSVIKKEYYKNNPDKHHWKSSNRSISKPCENFKRVIEETKLLYIPEMTISNERFFSIDIALPHYKIGIEINGNQHYESNGCLKEYYQKRHDYIISLGWKLYELHYSLCFNDDVIKSILNKIISNIDTIYDFDYDNYLLDKLNKNKQNICECGKNIRKQSKRCVACARPDSDIKRRKVERPTYESLIIDVENTGYSATGRKYGVSDNAVRKWIKSYKLVK